MKTHYTQEEFNNAKSNDELFLECYQCQKKFGAKKKFIKLVLEKYITPNGKSYAEQGCKYCSKTCQKKSLNTSPLVNCKNCNKQFFKILAEIKKGPNHFCSKSCAATYNNTHKTHGTRRSKLEQYLEEELIILYPDIHFDFNKKDTINSELDIYIPSLKLAIELNGIYHYEPIHGQDKLDQIQNNDHRKFQACLEKNIELLIIDTSSFGYFKINQANKFLSIITEIINKKI
jgi:hypothetical protein